MTLQRLLLLLLLYPAPLFAQDPAPPPPAPAAPAATQTSQPPALKISGLVFGDYYYFASSHDPDFEDQNGFWLRRAYLTLDHTMTHGFSGRLRLEGNGAGDMTDTRLTPFVKDAYLRWSSGSHGVLLGMSGTPSIEFIDSFWGYRFVEKTPLDLQRWDGTRDLGIAAQGTLGPGKTLNYHVMFGNGSDTGSEVNTNKTVRAAFGYRGTSGVVLEGYADWQDQPDDADRSTLQAFFGYRKPRGRIGLQYAHQTRRLALEPATGFDLASAFVVARVTGRHWILARVDRMFEPNPNGDRIPYLPFSTEAPSTLVIVGWDILLSPNVHVGPNVEFVKYGDAGGTPVRSDKVARMTFYFDWP